MRILQDLPLLQPSGLFANASDEDFQPGLRVLRPRREPARTDFRAPTARRRTASTRFPVHRTSDRQARSPRMQATARRVNHVLERDRAETLRQLEKMVGGESGSARR